MAWYSYGSVGQHGHPFQVFRGRLTVFNPILLCVRPVIKQHPSSANTMVRPVVDGAAVLVRLRAIDLGSRGAIVEVTRLDVGHVPEPVPLRAALRVQRVDVIVGVTGGDGLDGVFEGLAGEGGNGRDVQREAEGGVSMDVFGRRMPYLRLTISPSVTSLAAAATLGGVRRLRRPNCISSDRVLPSKFLVLPDHHFPKPMLYFRQRSIQIFAENCRLRVARAEIYV